MDNISTIKDMPHLARFIFRGILGLLRNLDTGSLFGGEIPNVVGSAGIIGPAGALGVGGLGIRGPMVALGRLQIRGALDGVIIRRIIRRHMNEVKYCYQKELQNPSLHGRAVVRFVINAEGQVTRSNIKSSTLAHRKVEECLKHATRRWLFPRPRAGVVTVQAPFVFRLP